MHHLTSLPHTQPCTRRPGRPRGLDRGKKWEPAVSRVLSRTVIHLGRPSPDASSSLPGCDAGHTMHPYLALLRTGFTLPRTVTSRAVRSYRTISPLPVPGEPDHRRYIFCGTFRRLAPPRRYLASCPMEPGLSSTSEDAATAWPTPALLVRRRARERKTPQGLGRHGPCWPRSARRHEEGKSDVQKTRETGRKLSSATNSIIRAIRQAPNHPRPRLVASRPPRLPVDGF